MQMLIRMFEKYPETEKVFPHIETEAGDQMRESGKLIFLATRVVQYVYYLPCLTSKLGNVKAQSKR